MSNQTIEYELDTLTNQQQYSLTANNTNWSNITDINGGNYSQGLITFNATALTATESGYVYHLQHALTHIPVTWTLEIAGGTTGGFFTHNNNAGGNLIPQNINAVTKKANHHFFHNAWCKLGGSDATQNSSGFLNLYLNEKKKERGELEKLYDDAEQYYLDRAESYRYVPATTTLAGYEINNFSERVNVDLDGTAPYFRDYNRAIYQRNKHFIDDSNNNPFNGLVSPNTFGNNFQPYFTNGASVLTWRDVLITPISDISDVFKECPPLLKLNGFELKIQMNCGSSAQWVVNYAPVATANSATISQTNQVQYAISSITSNNGNGQTCPLLISSASNTGLGGLTFTCANPANPVVTLKCTIGWGTQNSSPCRLLIPSHKLTESYLAKITRNPVYSIYAKSFFLDSTLTGFSSNQNVIRTLASQYYRPRKLYIVPFLSNQNTSTDRNAFMVSPFQSPISSAPTTCSVCKLRNFNINLGGQPLFSQEVLFMPSHFYDENYIFLNSADYSEGNHRSNPLKSGRITKSMWVNGCYNVYCVDLKKALTDQDDTTGKQLAINFNIDAPNNILYDFYIIVETESRYSIDCINGTMLQGDAFNQPI
jgi:hypothetical protein